MADFSSSPSAAESTNPTNQSAHQPIPRDPPQPIPRLPGHAQVLGRPNLLSFSPNQPPPLPPLPPHSHSNPPAHSHYNPHSHMHLLHPIPEEDSTSLSQSGSSPARSHSLPLDPAAAENATSAAAAAAAAAAGGGSSSSSGSGSSSTDSSRRVTFSEGVQLPERGRNSWRGDSEPASGREARRDIGREIGREQLGEGERTVVGAEPLMDEPVVMRDAGSLITSTGALEEGMRRSVGDGSALDGPDYGFGICAVDFDGGLGGGIGGEVGFERGGGGVERMWEGRT